MPRDDPLTKPGRDVRRDSDTTALVAALGTLAVVLVWLVLAGTGIAAAQNNSTVNETAPYYQNASASPGLASWVGDPSPTLPNVIDMALQGVGYWIGTGTGQGGGPAGTLVLALVVAGVVTGTLARGRVGAVAGATLAIATVALLASIGLAPVWMLAITLLVLGLVAVGVFLRSL
jgi:hypothetical protein